MAKIGVIVPVYNVERYLKTCVGSILAQTFSDFELILVDDGSTDASGRISTSTRRETSGFGWSTQRTGEWRRLGTGVWRRIKTSILPLWIPTTGLRRNIWRRCTA